MPGFPEIQIEIGNQFKYLVMMILFAK